MAVRKSSKLPQVTAIKQIFKRCSRLGRKNGFYTRKHYGLPLDVPRGHFVVYVGDKRSRFIVPISLFSMPEFQSLRRAAEEEFGFEHDIGLTIPCEEVVFRALTSFLWAEIEE